MKKIYILNRCFKMSDLLVIEDVSTTKIKTIINELYQLCVDNSILINHDIHQKYNEIDYRLAIERLPINTKIQIAITLSCLTSCTLCLEGSRRMFFLLWFIYDNISKSTLDDLMVRFIVLSKSDKYRHDIDKNNYMNYLFISHHILYYLNYKVDKEKATIADVKNDDAVLNCVDKLQKYIVYGSVIKTSSMLFYFLNKKEMGDVNWITTCVNEAMSLGNINKYDLTIRFLPLIFSACISHSHIFDNNISYITLILSITCGLICCNHRFTDCRNHLRFSNFSEYDVIIIRNVFNFSKECKYKKTYQLIERLIIDCRSIPNDNIEHISQQYIATTDLIIKQLKAIDQQMVKYNKSLVHHTEKPATQTNIPSLSVFFDDNDNNYTDLIKNQIVYYLDNYRYSIYDLTTNGKCYFFAEIGQNVDHNLKNGDTMLFYGPLIIGEEAMMDVVMRDQMKTDGILALNYYINNMKIKYDFKSVDSIPFFNFLNVDLTKYLEPSSSCDDNPRKIEKTMTLEDESFNIFQFMHQNNDIRSKLWLVMNDPFGDFRLRNWSMDILIHKNTPYVYNLIRKVDKFVFRNGEIVDFNPGQYIIDYITNQSTIASEILKKLYFIALFKALFGIDYSYSWIDFFIHINDNKNTVSISLMPHAKFSRPRYVPYDYDRRIVIPKNYSKLTSKIKFYTSSRIVREMKHNTREEQKAFFYNSFNTKTFPVMKELYTFLFNKDHKSWQTPMPQSIKDKLKTLYTHTHDKKDPISQFEYSIADTREYENRAIFGCMTYYVSKHLGLDPNVFGFDPFYVYYLEMGKKMIVHLPTMKMLRRWIWSIVLNTSLMSEIEPHPNTIYYRQKFKKKIKSRFSIHHFKGWLCQKENIKSVVSTIEDWEKNVHSEQTYINYIDDHKDSKLYNRLYNPDVKWLKTFWLPEVANAHKYMKNTYLELLNEEGGDLWNFCEFSFGKDFILSYLSYINLCVKSAARRQHDFSQSSKN